MTGHVILPAPASSAEALGGLSREVAVASVKGPRQTNADAFLIDQAAGLFAVADGIGDTPRSRAAARAALEAVRELFGEPWTLTLPTQRGTVEAAERMRLGVIQANGRLYVEGRERPLGTTFAGVVVCQDRLCVCGIGDSRVYVRRASTGHLERLTRDDTVLDEACRGGARREVAAAHPRAQWLTRAIGTRRAVAGWSVAARWAIGDVVLICTDGLTDRIDDDAIARALEGPGDLAAATLRLEACVAAAGARDNVTVLLVRRAGTPEH
jgi:protein phosphatase